VPVPVQEEAEEMAAAALVAESAMVKVLKFYTINAHSKVCILDTQLYSARAGRFL